MIKIKNVTMRNFLSVGNATQAVKLDTPGLTLVLGENLDLGGGGSRNGVGKCSCMNTKVKIRNTNTGRVEEITIGELYERHSKGENK